MLCLGRKAGESIIIGEDLKITVIGIDKMKYAKTRKNQVHLRVERMIGGETITTRFFKRVGADLDIREDVKLAILRVSQNQVSLGIKAPKTVAVDREEIRLSKLTKGIN